MNRIYIIYYIYLNRIRIPYARYVLYVMRLSRKPQGRSMVNLYTELGRKFSTIIMFSNHIYIIFGSALISLAHGEDIQVSKLFILSITPETFNWRVDERHDQFLYKPSLLNAPDLPPWIHYTYSKKDESGYLYGVAPSEQDNLTLEVVALNKNNYETRHKILNFNVLKKVNPAKNEVRLKIDNLNVDDLFNATRIDQLLDIFKNDLWKDASDLYVTFLASAIEMGARLPLKPEEGEGVVVRLGSSASFSQDMLTLQEEVKPLQKVLPCPRYYKRTSVERYFRSRGFILDWCSFKLIEEHHSHHQESARRDPNMDVTRLPSSEISGHTEWRWARPTKAGTPTRSYFKEMATTVLIPAGLLFVLVGFLSATLCFHHDKGPKREPTPVEGLGNGSEVQMVQYASSQRGTLRSLSAQPSSPSDSLTRGSRTTTERTNPYVRPNPPPYMGSNNVGGNRADF
ncbi:epsilon-sarcoglycan isoform X2 [Neodiprion virginianus]|uniref:epsilon-sarcoglycan isoform X2 n=1 Tax=Neodiprion virginianus TaxID=2961670 RepID=UPI001EE71E82|nr:epsilon-sarcoglycan isoform X2 [Neodiprion virginianus]